MNAARALARLLALTLIPAHSSSVEVGDAAVTFNLPDFFDGGQVSLEQFQGSVIYLDFWASWCAPCLRSFPFMNTLQQEFGEQGLVVIAVNLDQRREDAVAFLAEHPVEFIVVENQAGDLALQYDVIAMPSTYVIGRDGIVKHVHGGFRASDENDLRELIRSLL